jgi:hypothetical protein
MIIVFSAQLHVAVEQQNGQRIVSECSSRQMVYIPLGGRRFVSVFPSVATAAVDLL